MKADQVGQRAGMIEVRHNLGALGSNIHAVAAVIVDGNKIRDVSEVAWTFDGDIAVVKIKHSNGTEERWVCPVLNFEETAKGSRTSAEHEL